MCKCPFCLTDANNPKKFYLSINVEKNVFKCWYCKEYGGVLQFESMLTGTSFLEVKQKYFGDQKKKYHPAELLSPKQLEAINWADIKRNYFVEYKESLQVIIADWEAHVRENRILAFSKLLIGIETKKYKLVIDSIKKQAEDAQIHSLLDDILNMYSSSQWKDWALEARKIAGVAYKTSRQENNKFSNALIYVIFAFSQFKQGENFKVKRRVG